MNSGDFLGRIYTDGEVIFREGEKGEGMFIIQTGKVRIVKNTPTGEVTINEIGAGDILGEMALFDKLPRSATAVVSGEARILSVDRSKLFKLIGNDPTTVFKIIQNMSSRIRKLSEELSVYKKAEQSGG